jgi:hypothetical protein
LKFAQAYIDKAPPPEIAFDVDKILEGDRNGWLPDLHITADMDWSVVADDVKARADAASPQWEELYARWRDKKPTFEEVLAHELNLRNAKVGVVESLKAKCGHQNIFDLPHYPIARETPRCYTGRMEIKATKAHTAAQLLRTLHINLIRQRAQRPRPLSGGFTS